MEESKQIHTTDFSFLIGNPESVLKLNIEFIEEADGSGTIVIEWDEEDADLQWWTNLGEQKQRQFILDCLTKAVQNVLPNEQVSFFDHES